MQTSACARRVAGPAERRRLDAIFAQWVDGQPWWLTLLLLPGLVLAGAAAALVRLGLIAAALALTLVTIAGLARAVGAPRRARLWLDRRRRQ